MNSLNESTPYCLVLMPFGVEGDDIYAHEIQPAVENSGFQTKRLDEFASIDLFVSAVWRAIKNAQLIVADLTRKNPNVFYELGLAHALGKPSLILTQSIDDVPFDLKHLRVIKYDRFRKEPGLLKRRIAEALRDMSKYKESFLPLSYSELTTHQPGIEDKTERAKKLLEKAEEARHTGKISEAVEQIKGAIELYKGIENYRSLGTALNNLGTVYQEIGDYSAALSVLQEAVEALKGAGDPGGEAAVYGNLAHVFEARTEYKRAEDFYRRAIQISEQLGDESAVALHHYNLASLKFQQGDYDTAKKFYQRSLMTFEKHNNEPAIAQTYANLGLLSYSQGDSDHALKLFNRALASFERLGMRIEISHILHNLASLMLDKGDLDSAEKYLKKSLVIKEEVGDKEGIAASYANLGSLQASQGNLNKALHYLTMAVQIYEETGYSYGLAQALFAISRVLVAAGEKEQAEKILKRLKEFSRDLSPSEYDRISEVLKTLQNTEKE